MSTIFKIFLKKILTFFEFEIFILIPIKKIFHFCRNYYHKLFYNKLKKCEKSVAIFFIFIYNIMVWHHRQEVRHGSAKPLPPVRIWLVPPICRCGEMADAQDLKSWDCNRSCRFDPDHRHQKKFIFF